MQQNSGAKRSSALSKLKRNLPPQTQQSGLKLEASILKHENVQLTQIALVTGPARFSAATSHEQNDAYMQDFDKAYAELEALHVGDKYGVGQQLQHQ